MTSEVGPPKGASMEKILKELVPYNNRVDAFNVTDQQGAAMRLGSLAASIILKENGFEPIFQLTCRDRNRLALQADLLSAAAFGIETALALTGDHPAVGDHPEAKPVFDLDSVTLIDVMRRMEAGMDMNGHKLSGVPPRFCIGAAVNPGADPLEPEIIKMEKKVAAGAEFFQTQAVFDIEIFERFLKAARHVKAKIFAGIMFLKSEHMAQYMNAHIPGVFVPESLVSEMRQASDSREKCLEIALRLFNRLRPFCDGIHFMPVGSYGLVPAFLDAAGL